ncbi:DUF488 domain-containing protein [Chitinophaga lutea]
MIRLKRIYEPYESADGFRILVDRLWPRGVKKEDAHIDLWAKEVAPSTELRKWFHHDVAAWKEFEKRYKTELKSSAALSELIEKIRQHKKVTLLYSARDEEHNQAIVLRDKIMATL